jgi:DnaK suppressor protein
MIDSAHFRTILLARRADLENLLDSAAESRAPVELDQTSVGRLSRMDALQGQAMALASQRRRQTELAKIDAALRRIEEGEYGFCVDCGEEITIRRLEIDPAAASCVRCAAGTPGR